jgi:hypothetical protein
LAEPRYLAAFVLLRVERSSRPQLSKLSGCLCGVCGYSVDDDSGTGCFERSDDHQGRAVACADPSCSLASAFAAMALPVAISG